MRRIQLRKPSSAMVVATLALIVAVAGGGQAIAGQTARIAKQITGSNIKSGSVTAKQIKNGTITGKQVKNNSLTGRQIDESSLAEVPSAASATQASRAGSAALADDASAVEGLKFKQMSFSAPEGGSETILDYKGFRLTATCKAGNLSSLTMKNVSGGPAFADFRHFVSGVSDPSHAFNSNFAEGDSVQMIEGTAGVVEAELVSLSGVTITGTAIYSDGPTFGGSSDNCVIAGQVAYK
ncbi:MAG: hypothetical protein QM648_11380 [Solirubrobacterales bacterium]